MLTATVSEARDGSTAVKLRSGAGPVWTSKGITRAPGTQVVLAARADDLEIGSLGPPGSPGEAPTAAIPGVIRSRTYAGGRVEYLVEAGGVPIVVRAPEAGAAGSLLDAGSDAWVRFPADAAVLVNDDNAERAPQAAGSAVESVPVQRVT